MEIQLYKFPDTQTADENGIVALGGDLSIGMLYSAYTQGIFPWPIGPSYPMAWFSPDPRGVLFYRDLHVSHSLKKFLKKEPFTYSINQNFLAVIKNCAQVKRLGQSSTWITDQIVNSYYELFKLGLAYSIEVYSKENQRLVGGLYGVCIGKYRSGESMFHLENNASKAAILFLLSHLYEEEGIEWIDTQMVTGVIEQLGGKLIPRKDFLSLLSSLQSQF